MKEVIAEGGAAGAPFFTFGAVALAAAATFLAPGLSELTRGGLERGEVWRLLTGHLAHFSPWHFLVDAGTLFALGWIYERRLGARRWAAVLFAGAAAVSAAFLFVERPLEAYRGLSGLDCAAFAAAIVAEGRRHPKLAIGLGLAFAAKILYEQVTGGFLFPQAGFGDMGLPVLSAHTAGAASGFAAAVSDFTSFLPRRALPDLILSRTELERIP